MTLPSYVHPLPNWILKFPWFSRVRGFVFINNIYLRPEIHHDLKKTNPKLINQSILLHELTHRTRANKIGKLKFGILYLFNPHFRFNEELEGYKSQISILKESNTPYYFEKKAKALSSWIYLWSTDYNTALRELKKAWEEN